MKSVDSIIPSTGSIISQQSEATIHKNNHPGVYLRKLIHADPHNVCVYQASPTVISIRSVEFLRLAPRPTRVLPWRLVELKKEKLVLFTSSTNLPAKNL